MPLMLVIGTINRYKGPGDDWQVVHVDKSSRGIYDPDRQRGVPIDVQADMRNLPFENQTVDRIQSWHALEHVNEQGGHDTVHEFARVLKPDGILDLRVPDLEHILRTGSIGGCMGIIYGDQTPMADPELSAHLWGYTLPTLAFLLKAHGFEVDWINPKPEHPDEIHLHAVRG